MLEVSGLKVFAATKAKAREFRRDDHGLDSQPSRDRDGRQDRDAEFGRRLPLPHRHRILPDATGNEPLR